MRTFVIVMLVALSVAADAKRSRGAPPDSAGGTTAPDRQEHASLPDGTIREGTLANAKLVIDATAGVGAACGVIGLEAPKRVEPFVVQEPAGAPGGRCWRETWIIEDGRGRFGRIDFRFEEDGRGGAFWTVEDASRLPGPAVPQVAEADPGDRSAHDGDAAGDASDGVDADRFLRAARRFVESATQGDTDGMVAVTSLITIANEGGAEAIKKRYLTRFVPRFDMANVEWQDRVVPMMDETGNRGVEISCSVEGKKPFRLYLWVMKEGGKHVVTGVSGKPHAELVNERK